MYLKIVDTLDARMLAPTIQEKSHVTSDRIMELAEMLDTAYGRGRKSGDMGGFILYFPTVGDFSRDIDTIYDFYNIRPDRYEYEEQIEEAADRTGRGTSFMETLYMQGQDDAIVLIRPSGEG